MVDSRGGIYEIKNGANGLRYLGSSKNLANRFRQHRNDLKAGKHRNERLQRSWAKYGKGTFEFRILAILEVSEQLTTEQRLLAHAGNSGEDLYNIAVDVTSGMKGRKMTDEQRNAKSICTQALWRDPDIRERMVAPRRGKPHMGEHNENIRRTMQSPEMHQRLSDMKTAERATPEGHAKYDGLNIGRKHSSETLNKMSLVHRAFYLDPVMRQEQSDRIKRQWAKRKMEKNSP